MMNVKPVPAIALLIIFSLLVWVVFGVSQEGEPNEGIVIIDPNFTGIDMDWEPDYPIDLRLCGNDANYVEFKAGKDNEIVCDSTREKYLKILYQSLTGKEPNRPVTLGFEEPNEPEDIIATFDSERFRLIVDDQDWQCTTCGQLFDSFEERISHYCLDPKVKELTLGIIREAIQGFINQGYTLDHNAASEGRIEFIEPNEPECNHDRIVGFSQGFHSSSTWCAVCGDTIKTYELGDPNAVLHYHEPEPEPMKYSLPIPTWPDYIELEKDLIFNALPYDPNYPGNGIVITKGTKIYFSEKD